MGDSSLWALNGSITVILSVACYLPLELLFITVFLVAPEQAPTITYAKSTAPMTVSLRWEVSNEFWSLHQEWSVFRIGQFPLFWLKSIDPLFQESKFPPDVVTKKAKYLFFA